MPWPLFTPGKDPVPIVQEAGWAPGPVWTGVENLTPTRIQSPNCPAHSRSLYRLSYPTHALALSDPTLDLVRQYDFPVLLRCRKTSNTVFVVFVRPLSEPVRRFSSCSTDFSQQIAQVVLFLILYVFLF
jgi:hypothetical protein